MEPPKEPEPVRSYAMESSGCISLMDGDGQPSFLGCMLSCMERPVEEEGLKPSQAAGDILAQAEVEERKGNYSAASELYRRALDESARLERREEERDRRRTSGCLSNPVGWCLDATSPL